MYCDLPVFKRCCFCLPLRRGILILAYVNILFNILDAVIFSVDMPFVSVNRNYENLPYGLNITLFVLDAVATITLIVGLHMKNELVVKIYYHFLLATLSAQVLLTIIDISLMKYEYQRVYTAFYFIFTSVFNVYLLLLVRSAMKKLQVSDGNFFGNRLADFIEGAPAEREQNHTVAITLPTEIDQ